MGIALLFHYVGSAVLAGQGQLASGSNDEWMYALQEFAPRGGCR